MGRARLTSNAKRNQTHAKTVVNYCSAFAAGLSASLAGNDAMERLPGNPGEIELAKRPVDHLPPKRDRNRIQATILEHVRDRRERFSASVIKIRRAARRQTPGSAR